MCQPTSGEPLALPTDTLYSMLPEAFGKFWAHFSFVLPCLTPCLRGLVLWGDKLSALPACLCAWPVFSHCQYLLDSNSKHGIHLGSPFLPVPRETHSKWNTSVPPVLGSPHSGWGQQSRMWPLYPSQLKFSAPES